MRREGIEEWKAVYACMKELESQQRGVTRNSVVEALRQEARETEEEGKQSVGRCVHANARVGAAMDKAHGNSAKEGQRRNDQTTSANELGKEEHVECEHDGSARNG